MPTSTQNPDGTYTLKAAPSANPTANPNYAFQVPGQTPTLPTVPPPASSTMSVNALGTQPLNLAPTTPLPPVAGALPVVPQTNGTQQNGQTQTQQPQQNAQPGVADNLNNIFTSLTGKDAATNAAVTTAEAPYQKQLNDINTQIATQQANAIAHQEAALRSGETLGYASREAQNVQRTDAIESLKLSALQSGLQGNIALAEKQATAAVDAQFAQKQQDLETAKTNIYNNYDTFTAAEKKKADAALLRIDAQDAFVKAKKEDQSAIYAMALTAMTNNPGDTAISRAAQKAIDSGDLATAFNLVGQYQSDPIDTAIKIQQLQKLRNENNPTSGGAGEQLYSGLSSATATAVRARVNKFASEQSVTNFSTIQDGYNFAKSISSKTTNPADDQALIYALAKTLDPGSVVREGEYATAQKYAQSYIQSYGKSVTQALAGTGFLSETARNNIKNVIETKYNSAKKGYDQTTNSYVTGINSLTGRSDGTQFLTDYVTTTPAETTKITVVSPQGVTGEISKENLLEAFKSGYSLPAGPMDKLK